MFLFRVRLLIPILALILMASCVSNRKIVYMQELEETEDLLISKTDKIPYKTEEYRLQPNDIVEINIHTSSPELNALFSNLGGGGEGQATNSMAGQNGGDIFFLNGFTLEDDGSVELPVIGKIRLEGLTTEEAKERLEEQVQTYITEGNYFVRVRLGGVRFSALGEFNAPGKITILQNRVTIFEAIAAAGDLNAIAKRKEIVLVRQYPEGSQIHRIDLTNEKLLSSEYYFIRPNDLIYAEPLKIRELGTGTTLIQTIALFTSALTTIALILSLTNQN